MTCVCVLWMIQCGWRGLLTRVSMYRPHIVSSVVLLGLPWRTIRYFKEVWLWSNLNFSSIWHYYLGTLEIQHTHTFSTLPLLYTQLIVLLLILLLVLSINCLIAPQDAVNWIYYEDPLSGCATSATACDKSAFPYSGYSSIHRLSCSTLQPA